MARLEFFVVAESVSIDQLTNKLSVFNVLEEVREEEFPTTLLGCVVVSLWNAEPGDEERDFQIQLEMVAPDGQTRPFEQNLRIPRRRTRSILQLRGIPVPCAGELVFRISLNNEYKASHVVHVVRDDDAGHG